MTDGAEIRRRAVQVAAAGSFVTIVLGGLADGGESDLGVALVWIIGLAGSLLAGVVLYGIGWMVELFGPPQPPPPPEL